VWHGHILDILRHKLFSSQQMMMLQQHLQETEKPIALGAQHLYDQRALVARLEWDGRHDEVTAAKALVAQLEDALRAGPMGQGPPPNSDSEL